MTGDDPNATDCANKDYAASLHVTTSSFSLVEGTDFDVGLRLEDCGGWVVDEWHDHRVVRAGAHGVRRARARARRRRAVARLGHGAAGTQRESLLRPASQPRRAIRPPTSYALFKTVDGRMRAYVRAGGPAYAAGLRTGDVVDKLDGKYWWEYGTYQTQQRAYDGKPHSFEIERGGKTLDVQLGAPFVAATCVVTLDRSAARRILRARRAARPCRTQAARSPYRRSPPIRNDVGDVRALLRPVVERMRDVGLDARKCSRPAAIRSHTASGSAHPGSRRCSSTATTTCSRSIRSSCGRSPPFEATRARRKDLRPRHGRRQGPSADASRRRSKRTCARAERLPINVKVVVEGEEEIGSPNFDAAVERYRERISRPIVAVISDTAVYAEDVPSLTTSLRGLVHWEITVARSGATTLHSGYFGGVVRNPIEALAAIRYIAQRRRRTGHRAGILRRRPRARGRAHRRTCGARVRRSARSGEARRAANSPANAVVSRSSGCGFARRSNATESGVATAGPEVRRSCRRLRRRSSRRGSSASKIRSTCGAS